MNLSKTFRRVALGSMISATAISVSQQALAALTTFVSVKGKKQGQFKSEATTAEKRKDKWMPVVSFSFGLQSPRDLATGQASGKRRYDPVCFVKETGAATPQFLSAAATNEVLAEVSFEFTKTNPQGQEYVYQTVMLNDATVSKVTQSMGHAGDTTAAATIKHTAGSDASNLEEICFTFRKVTVTNMDGKTTFSDDWSSPM